MTHASRHARTRTYTPGWTPLDDGSARHKGLYVHNTKHSKYEEKTIRSVGLEPVIPASKRLQTYSLYRDAVKHKRSDKKTKPNPIAREP